MKPKLLLWIALALTCGCRSTGSAPHQADGNQVTPGGAALAGDAQIEAHLEIAGASLERVLDGIEAAFVLRNRDARSLEFEFLVQGYARSGRELPGARTAWVLLSLGPREERRIRSSPLPPETDSWRLITRRPKSR